MVGLVPGAHGGQPGLGFAVAPGPSPLAALLDDAVRDTDADGAVAEVSPAALALAHTIAGRLLRRRGTALIIDYGYEAGSHGDTLQAVRRHAPADIFAHVGDSDLTAHVDFACLARAAREAGAAVDGPVAQGAFLRALGISLRARALLARATPAQAAAIDAGMQRLITPERMGTLFRVLAVRDPASPPSPGFAPDDSPVAQHPGTET
jgi:NADH dehydrogenase [ubiquinone] 1 alpha subcomplex assembly factor 7